MSSHLTYTSAPSFDHRAPDHYPLRRQHVAQPPTLLTTSLNNSARGIGPGSSRPDHVQTPLSTSSLSVPFAAHNSPIYPPSPGIAASPMTFRQPAAPVLSQAPYNPQQWARGGGGGGGGNESSPVVGYAAGPFSPAHARQVSQTVAYAPRLIGPDEPLASPPPPYSADASDPSPAPTTSPEPGFSPATACSSASTMSPGGPGIPLSVDRRSPNVQYGQSQSPAAAFPPPPSAGRVRSSSRTHTERLLSAMNLRSRQNAASPPANIETLQQTTAQLLGRAEQAHADASRPPTTRRAVSAGGIIGSTYSTRSPLVEGGELIDMGLSLPPPPPGPPPASSRSQSLQRLPGMVSQVPAAPTVAPRDRRPPGRGTELGPVPPTPANWGEEDPITQTEQTQQTSRPAWQQQQSLHLETDNITRVQLTDSPAAVDSPNTASHARRDSSSLVRSPAVRNRSAQGLRERRSASKSGRAQGSGDSETSDPLSRPLGDLVLNDSAIMQRRISTRRSPRSSRSFRGLDEALSSADTGFSPQPGTTSARSTPRPEIAEGGQSASKRFSTPLISPLRDEFSNSSAIAQSLETPPTPGSNSLRAPSNPNGRPLSHILHAPNEENTRIKVMPLSPESTHSLMDLDASESPIGFSDRAIERHRLFIQKEAQAANDSERLQLFTQYMIAESRIRREKYAAVFDAENLQAADLMDGMFSETQSSEPEVQKNTSRASFEGSRRSSATSYADSASAGQHASSSAASEPPSLTIDTSIGGDVRGKNFVPCLSPIASMSAVTGRDEMDSRGRAPSRWWEDASNSSNVGDGFKVLERSKRESKYMSAVLESDMTSPPLEVLHHEASSSQLPGYGENEYPPEKVGWHEEVSSAAPQATYRPPSAASAPFTPDPRKLDISRLITLPPPYPRHHPAVNNSHPDLADTRNVVRSLNQPSEVEAAKERFETEIREKRRRANSWCEHQKSLHDQDMQFRMDRGEISQQEYDEAEVALECRLSQSAKDLAQSTFDLFQSLVATPLHAIYKDRIARATDAFSALSARLHSDSDTHSPNLPQEAGDEKPELLEKLTMLKWLFEAREALHRDSHALLTLRNEHYKALVLLPYQQPSTRNEEKLADAQRFFAADALRRQAAADGAALSRWTEFLTIIETHVTRGVEVQLSAFWDIAPPLQALLQQVPSDKNRLRSFQILIPKEEVDENPAYWRHPLRYLYSVLLHAGASSRQFVDGQVSLWCLLQEVREGQVGAKWRARESARLAAQSQEGGGEGGGGSSSESDRTINAEQQALENERRRDEMRKGEEVRRGVEDLKEKVAALEEQWIEGLGGEIGRVREGVRAWLEMDGGWDEELEEGE